MENEDIEGTKYEAFIATSWKTITLDTPLSPDSDTDTDWDVLNFLSPSVVLRISTDAFSNYIFNNISDVKDVQYA